MISNEGKIHALWITLVSDRSSLLASQDISFGWLLQRVTSSSPGFPLCGFYPEIMGSIAAR